MEVKYIWNKWGPSSLCYCLKKKTQQSGEFPGSLVVGIQHCHSSGQASIPGWGTEILKSAWCDPIFKKILNNNTLKICLGLHLCVCD